MLPEATAEFFNSADQRLSSLIYIKYIGILKNLKDILTYMATATSISGGTTQEKKEILALIRECRKILKAEPSYMKIPSDRPIVFVGDTHGDYETTEEILKRYSGTHTIVFLGDYINRAPLPNGSLINTVMILKEKRRHPESTIMLKGNHEFLEIMIAGMFDRDIREYFLRSGGHREVFSAILKLFGALPYAAHLGNVVLALHGGLPNANSITEFRSIPKGILDNSYLRQKPDDIASQVVWNSNVRFDYPEREGNEIYPSAKGNDMNKMFCYGRSFFEKKMRLLRKRVLIRGHDQDSKGYSMDGRILTVLTSRRYKNSPGYDNRPEFRRNCLLGSFVAVLDPQKRIMTARDLDLDVLVEPTTRYG